MNITCSNVLSGEKGGKKGETSCFCPWKRVGGAAATVNTG